jgi:hypothetical protein
LYRPTAALRLPKIPEENHPEESAKSPAGSDAKPKAVARPERLDVQATQACHPKIPAGDLLARSDDSASRVLRTLDHRPTAAPKDGPDDPAALPVRWDVLAIPERRTPDRPDHRQLQE